MAELCLLGEKISLGFVGWSNLNGNSLGNREAGFLERLQLSRIVRHEADTLNSEVAQDVDAEPIIAMVRFESQLVICCYGIVPSILKFVGHQFVHEAYSASFLQLINKDARSRVRNGLLCHRQLLATIAAARAKYITRETLGMNPNQRSLGLRQCAFHQNNGTV